MTASEQTLAIDLREPRADTLGEALAKTRLRRGLFDRQDNAPKLDRYTVLQRLGEGGFGVVYAAYDERLDRKVALKVLRVGAGNVARNRLVDEAKALAKLAHPNIVSVFDVSVLPDGNVLLAMEYIRGQTLAAWARPGKPWTEVVDVFQQAARGLAAAHAESIVHRDFKPANAMLGDDQRVRVLDFGLARVVHSPATLREGTDQDPSSTERTMEVVGTAAYMPPEQHRGERADARSDQYALCVSLWKALYGRPPFEGPTLETLLEAKLRGPPVAPADAMVPARIRAAVERGLVCDPNERHPDLSSLIDALSPVHDPWKRRMTWGIPLVIVAGVAMVGAIATRAEEPCARSVDALEAVWNDSTQAEIHAAFEATQRPYASTMTNAVVKAVDPWARTWREAQREACESHEREALSSELFDLEGHCLRLRLSELEARVERWTSADAATVDKAVETAHSLPRIEPCTDPAQLRAATPLPTDPEAMAQIEAWGARLSSARTNEDAGRYERAMTLANEVLEAYDDQAIEYIPTRARALVLRGRARSRLGQIEHARQDLETGALLALSAGEDRLFADASAEMVWELGEVGGRFEEAAQWARLGEASLQRSGGDPYLRASLHNNLGAVLSTQGRYDEALAEHRARLSLVAEHWGADGPLAAVSIINIANVHNHRGDIEQAIAGYDEGLLRLGRAYGPEHPKTLTVAQNRMGLLWHSGRLAEALDAGRAIAEAQARVLGPRHPDRAATLGDLAVIENRSGQSERALAHVSEARTIIVEAYGEESHFLHAIDQQRAQALTNLGRHDEARAVAMALLTSIETGLGPEHINVAHCEHVLGLIELGRQKPEQALIHLGRAQALFESHGNRSMAAITLLPQADTLAELGRLDDAQRAAEQAVTIFGEAPEHDAKAEQARMTLKRVMQPRGESPLGVDE